MNVECLIENKQGILKAYDPTFKTYQDAIGLCVENPYAKYSIQIEHSDEYYVLDFNEMITEIPDIMSQTDWTGFLSVLTEDDLIYYATDEFVPTLKYTDGDETGVVKQTNNDNVEQANYVSPLVHSCDHESGVYVHYGLKGMSVRNERHLKWKLVDLICGCDTTPPVVDIGNCVPIVNGICYYPYEFNNEIWMEGAAKALRSTSGGNFPTLLMDFTSLGGMTPVKLSDCEIVEAEAAPRYHIRMPDGVSMEDTTPFLVIAGRIFFRHEFKILNNTTLKVDFSNYNLDAMLIANKNYNEDFIFNTLNATDKGATDYINKIMAEFVSDAFIFLVHNPYIKMMYHRPLMTLGKHNPSFQTGATGLLVRDDTREVLDYTKLEYDRTMWVNKWYGEQHSALLKTNPNDLPYTFSYRATRHPMRRVHKKLESRLRSYRLIDLVAKEI